MPFGKYRGRPLADIPDAYVHWLASLQNLREPLRAAVHREAQRRRHAESTRTLLPVAALPIAHELITAGYRVLTKTSHPDVGGDHPRMVLLNATVTWLRAVVRGVGRGAPP
jgi:Putative quorum-sensing-regulated virulence factor